MNIDRQYFKKDILKNNLTVWSHRMDVPFAEISVVVPVGTAHSHDGNQGGAQGMAHFLEHMCGERSNEFPERHSFEKAIALCGGNWNAWTNAFTTTFNLRIPAAEFTTFLPGFINHIFKPLFKESDIILQRDIVRNERAQHKYFPSDDELHQYKFTKWMGAEFFSKESVFGDDDDLVSFTKDSLSLFHEYYFLENINVFVGGAYDEMLLHTLLNNINTKTLKLTEKYEAYSWKRREFHTFETKDIEMPIYSIGNLTSIFKLDDILGIGFLCELFVDQQHGSLNNWIRKEKGWSYGASSTQWYSKNQLGWTIDIPLNDTSVVKELRAKLHQHLVQTISDDQFVAETKNRLIKSMCFNFQTLSERINSATESILCFGINVTEEMYVEWLETHAHTEFLLEIYDSYFSPSVSGELLAIPKKVAIN